MSGRNLQEITVKKSSGYRLLPREISDFLYKQSNTDYGHTIAKEKKFANLL